MGVRSNVWRSGWQTGLTLVAGIAVGLVLAHSVAAGIASLLLGALFVVGGAWLSARRAGPGEAGQSADRLEPAAAIADPTRDGREHAHDHRPQLAGVDRDTLLLQSVLATMVEGVAVVDSRSRLLYLNPAARRLLEVRERDWRNRLLQEVVRSPQMHAAAESILASAAEARVEIELTREERTLALSGVRLSLEPRPGAVLVMHDVTELRRMERQRREFASNVSHELKTPLTSIQAYADALLEGGLDDPAINRSFVERILNQSERLGRLVHDLLSLARLEAVAQPDEWESLPLAEVIREVLPEHQSLADARGLELRLEVTVESPRIRADAEGVRTILDNLVRNALSYTPAGGRVLVRLRSEPGRALLEVEDTGVGIPREHQARVFERFFRVDRARSREQGGTGLGLSIVQDLATRFGAEVELESEPGRGSLFRVRFPQAPAPSASAAGPDA